MRVSTLLQESRDRITDPRHWTTTATARDERDEVVPPSSDRAVKFCAEGSLLRTRSEHGESYVNYFDVRTHLRRASSQLHGDDVDHIYANDTLGHAAVLAIYDRAIELAKQDEAGCA